MFQKYSGYCCCGSFFVGIAFVKFEKRSVITIMYWFPLLVLRRGPIISMVMISSGSVARNNCSFVIIFLLASHARKIHSSSLSCTRALECEASSTVCAFCRTYTFPLVALSMLRSVGNEGSPDGNRLRCLYVLPHLKIPRVQEGFSSPRQICFVVCRMFSILVGILDLDIGLLVVVKELVYVSCRLRLARGLQARRGMCCLTLPSESRGVLHWCFLQGSYSEYIPRRISPIQGICPPMFWRRFRQSWSVRAHLSLDVSHPCGEQHDNKPPKEGEANGQTYRRPVPFGVGT